MQAVSKPLADFMSRAKSSTRHFFDPASVNPFAAMGVRYVGPVDGHNVQELVWLIERLVDLDEGMQEWRYRHVKMVERTIGMKPGTGGSAGAQYLRTTLAKPAFPDLWEIRGSL